MQTEGRNRMQDSPRNRRIDTAVRKAVERDEALAAGWLERPETKAAIERLAVTADGDVSEVQAVFRRKVLIRHLKAMDE